MIGALTLAWGALKSPLAGYIGIAAAVVLGLWLVVVEAQLGEAHGQLEKVMADWTRAVADLTTCHGNQATLEGTLKAQSKAYGDLADAGQQALAQGGDAIAKLTEAQKTTRALASTVLAMKPQDDQCKANYEILGRAGR